ncbi:MAG: hypothetical protein ACOVSW_11965 [Candidatus Kapaibacteriota bacterium]
MTINLRRSMAKKYGKFSIHYAAKWEFISILAARSYMLKITITTRA